MNEAAGQTFTSIKHRSPTSIYYALLLTDGSVLAQAQSASDWYRYTPDAYGSYTSGTWTRLASTPAGFAPSDGSGFVLADGRMFYLGGEYNYHVWTLNSVSLVYDPVHNYWAKVPPPAGWTLGIGDSPAAMRPDGRLLVGEKRTKLMALLNPATLTWTPVKSTGKADWFAEENWSELPDGQILNVDVSDHPQTELFTPDPVNSAGNWDYTGHWRNAGRTPADLWQPYDQKCSGRPGYYCPPGEIGPDLYLANGKVFASGGLGPGQKKGQTAIYTPGANGAVGRWSGGPSFLPGDAGADTWSVNLPNGDVLIQGNTDFGGRNFLYIYNNFELVPLSFKAPRSFLLLLPSGQVLVGGNTIMTPSPPTSAQVAAWQPRITNYPAYLPRGSTLQIVGQQFNGVTRGGAFGDEDENQTSYPLVRLTNLATGRVVYARTHNHSTMAIATGTKTVWTYFDVPAAAEQGTVALTVVANGIASRPVYVDVVASTSAKPALIRNAAR